MLSVNCIDWYSFVLIDDIVNMLFFFTFAAQWNEWYSPGELGICKGMSISIFQTMFLHVIFIIFMSYMSLLCRAGERFHVIYPCWKSIRIWTGTQKFRLWMCGLCTSVTTEPWSSTGTLAVTWKYVYTVSDVYWFIPFNPIAIKNVSEQLITNYKCLRVIYK